MYYAAKTETGPVRSQNEDTYLAFRLAVDWPEEKEVFVFLGVADGVGGAVAGERASRLSLSSVGDYLLGAAPRKFREGHSTASDLRELMQEGIRRANAAVLKEAKSEGLTGMGSTLTAAVLHRGVLQLCQVGDSRCYRFRAGKLEQLTSDHSFVGELVRMGSLSPDAVRRHPRRNVITRAVGAAEELDADFSSQVVQTGDLYVFCSDGLWEGVRERQMEGFLAEAIPPQGVPNWGLLSEACDRLIGAALQEGASDNITALIAAVEQDDSCAEAAAEPPPLTRTRVESGRTKSEQLGKTIRYRAGSRAHAASAPGNPS